MKGQTNKFILDNKLQRVLRKNMTEAEQLLWRHLRRGQMGGSKFRRQHPFGDYILDFVCLESRLVIEVDGGHHAERHEQDNFRTVTLEAAGFRVLRFWNHEILGGLAAVKEVIWQALQLHPHPRLPPEGEGV